MFPSTATLSFLFEEALKAVKELLLSVHGQMKSSTVGTGNGPVNCIMMTPLISDVTMITAFYSNPASSYVKDRQLAHEEATKAL
ncbi:hypothetical protein L2E82_48427 [Cichorium intybus]|uniref:Uncharacterized protein n=1 Tax=Cichorium intybus TaxID=13427 RepID=A0ACB8YYC9_CICIN|nr:hypothetical protein L2E82_48427 [Cichorium intybus]